MSREPPGDVPAAVPAQVLAVFDEASAAAAVLEISTVLAQLTRRALQLVYVESTAALAAAELSSARVLAPSTASWSAFAPPDVERAWRAQALRLRALAERASQAKAVPWSLRVTRGALRDTALALLPGADLLLVGGTAGAFAAAAFTGSAAASRRVVALRRGTGAGEDEVSRVAERLAAALNARLLDLEADDARLARVDLVVAPARLGDARSLAAALAPTLYVRRSAACAHSRT